MISGGGEKLHAYGVVGWITGIRFKVITSAESHPVKDQSWGAKKGLSANMFSNCFFSETRGSPAAGMAANRYC